MTADWTSGYVADVAYTYGYYTELNPARIKLVFANLGLACPEVGVACELGFGQGLSANMHAAASTVSWFGTDFNPAQAACAAEFAEASGSNAKLYDDSFEDFANRSDIPEFDYIGLHGIWSWVSDSNRKVLVDFIKRKLKVGGVLYISYNTLPGWSTFAPMRHLMTLHAELIGSAGTGIVNRIDEAISFADNLVSTNPLFARANPAVKDRINKLKEQNRHYLAHEYFNKDWHPMHFASAAEWLSPAKLTYAGSAHLLDHVDNLNLTAEQQAFVDGFTDVTFRESVRDFMTNQQFRRDYWVKGALQLSVLEKSEIIRGSRVVLAIPRSEVVMKVNASLGEAAMSEAIYNPILDYLADHKIRSIENIESAVSSKGVSFPQIVQAVLVLCSQGSLVIAQDDAVIAKAKKTAAKLNAHIMQKSRSGNDITYLASPVSGGGLPMSRFNQLFAQAYLQGKRSTDDLAAHVWSLLKIQNQKLVRDGKTVESENENIEHLKEHATHFDNKVLPLLKALQII